MWQNLQISLVHLDVLVSNLGHGIALGVGWCMCHMNRKAQVSTVGPPHLCMFFTIPPSSSPGGVVAVWRPLSVIEHFEKKLEWTPTYHASSHLQINFERNRLQFMQLPVPPSNSPGDVGSLETLSVIEPLEKNSRDANLSCLLSPMD